MKLTFLLARNQIYTSLEQFLEKYVIFYLEIQYTG